MAFRVGMVAGLSLVVSRFIAPSYVLPNEAEKTLPYSRAYCACLLPGALMSWALVPQYRGASWRFPFRARERAAWLRFRIGRNG